MREALECQLLARWFDLGGSRRDIRLPARRFKVSPEARGVHSRVHTDAQEAELSLAEGGASQVNECHGSDDLYSRRGPQFAGALDCRDPGWARQRSARGSLPRDSRDAGFRRGDGPPARTVQIRGQEAESFVGRISRRVETLQAQDGEDRICRVKVRLSVER